MPEGLLACDAETALAVDDDGGDGLCSSISPDNDPGAGALAPQTYFIEVRGFGSSTGAYELLVDTEAPSQVCTPNERDCAGSTVTECRDDGHGADPIAVCGSSQRCSNGECVSSGGSTSSGGSSGSSGSSSSSSQSCNCSCRCSGCTATVSCTGACGGSCYAVCQDTCTSDPYCGSYISSSGSCN